jgi:branched-subunit amino acid aminotransferase/4-amino-4-deoxychorismate lyase
VELELVFVSSQPLSQHKLTSYGPVLWLGRQWAPCGIVLVDGEGFLREAATANIFFLFGQKVVTPPEGRILPGTVRRWCLGRLAQLGVEVAEEEVHLEQLAAATGAFLTASVSGLLPVRRLGPHRFPLPSWVVELLTSQGFPAPGYRQRRQRRTGKPPRLEP